MYGIEEFWKKSRPIKFEIKVYLISYFFLKKFEAIVSLKVAMK